MICCAKQQRAAFFSMNFIKIAQNQFHETADENLIYVYFVCHLTTLPCDLTVFNWRDGIRYSYISFCAKSASISLVDFSMDIVASKKYFRLKFQV